MESLVFTMIRTSLLMKKLMMMKMNILISDTLLLNTDNI